MIPVTKLDRRPMMINADLIERIEITPDTVIALTNGQRWIVLESAEEVAGRVLDYRRRTLQPPVDTVVGPVDTVRGFSALGPGQVRH